MGLVNMKDMLCKAREKKYAVGNFDVFNVEMITGVIRAAEESKSPVILAYGGEFEQVAQMDDFAAYVKSIAERTSVPVALHLDHATEFGLIMRALRAGFTSIMVDASFCNLQDNITTTKRVVDICREFGVTVEAELGHVGGLEFYDVKEYEECYTDVKEAKYFVGQTGVDALAVAVGTVHGVYKSKPCLNIDRLAQLNTGLDIPLVLHGGSGLSDEDLQNCVKNGVSKVNIFTDLTLAAIECMKEEAVIDTNYLKKCKHVSDAVKKVALKRMQVLKSIHMAD